jgi:inorganic pyrophosphatase
MDYWHDVPLGDNAPEEFNVIIEIPKGSHNKYEIDKETGLIKLDRANYGPTPYPFDYGFAPQSYWDDNDPLDVIVMTTSPLFPGILVNARPVAVMEMIDDGESDYKIIAVPVDDLRWENVKDLDDLNAHTIKEFQNFFETYKALKNKEVKIEAIKGADEAKKAILRSVELYEEKFNK